MESSDKPSSITDLIRRHFLTLLLAAYLCASVFPWFGLLLRTEFLTGTGVSSVHVMLSILLLTLGLATPLQELRQVFRQLNWLVAFFGIRHVLAIGLAMTSAWVPLELSGLWAGFILLLSAPTAASSSGWSFQMRSSKATIVALLLGTTLLSVIAGPLLLGVCARLAPAETGEALASLRESFRVRLVLPWVILPMALGMTLRTCLPVLAERLRDLGLQATPIVLLLLNYSNASSSLPSFAAEFSGNYLMLVLLGALATFVVLVGLAWCSSRVIAADAEQRTSALIGISMSNTGFMLVVATLAMPARADVHLPIIAYTFIQHLGMARIAKAGQGNPEHAIPSQSESVLTSK